MIVAAGTAVTLLAVVRLALLGPAPGETDPDAADDADDGHRDGSATARVDRIVAGVLLALLGLVLIAIGLLWG